MIRIKQVNFSVLLILGCSILTVAQPPANDEKAAIAKKLADATPKPLPQTPAINRPKTDVDEEFLKGRVRSVVETNEYLGGTGSVVGIKNSDESHFDENGNYTKRIFFDYRGNPSDVTVYGFIDGKRASKRGDYIAYEYNPPLMVAPPPSAGSKSNTEIQKPSDSRYSERFEFAYDDRGRLTEKSVFSNRGILNRKEVYTYEGNKVYESTFDKDGKLTWKTLSVFDDKLNLVERTYFSTSTSYPDDAKYAYTYQAFDEYGNWTKREVKGKTAKYGGGTKDIHRLDYRTILYY